MKIKFVHTYLLTTCFDRKLRSVKKSKTLYKIHSDIYITDIKKYLITIQNISEKKREEEGCKRLLKTLVFAAAKF